MSIVSEYVKEPSGVQDSPQSHAPCGVAHGHICCFVTLNPTHPTACEAGAAQRFSNFLYGENASDDAVARELS